MRQLRIIKTVQRLLRLDYIIDLKIIDEGNFYVNNFIKIIWNARRYLIVSYVLFSIPTVIYILNISPLFLSKSTTYHTEANSAGRIQQQLGALGFGGIIGGNRGNSYYVPDIIQSRWLKENIIHKEWYFESDADSLTWFEHVSGNRKTGLLSRILGSKQSTAFEVSTQDSFSIMNRLVALFNKRFIVETNPVSGLMTLSVITEEPGLSENVANYIISQVVDFVNERESLALTNSRKFIEQQIVETINKLNEAELATEQFLSDNRSIENSPTLQYHFGRLRREVVLAEEVYILLKKELETTRIAEQKIKTVVHVLDYPSLPFQRYYPRRKSIFTMISMVFLMINCIGMVVYHQYVVFQRASNSGSDGPLKGRS